jgi:ribose/xylose/arabinose/galactoside ABC-type transport system permease subunit
MSSSTPASRWAVPLQQIALLAAIVLVFVLTGLLDGNHTYFTNFRGSGIIILRNAALLGIIALGASVVIISGGIDLSSGSMVAFSASMCAIVMMFFTDSSDQRLANVSGLGIVCGFLAAIAAGFFVGTLHTWLITAIRLPPFVATLATLVGLRSFARALCEFVTKVRWGVSPRQQINVNTALLSDVKEYGVWISTVVFIALALGTWVILSRTVLGRHIYALGGNEQAARLSGVRTDNVKWFAYCFGSITAAIAGWFLMVDARVAQPVDQARGYELNAIAAAVIGGCSLQGGIGTVAGTVLGAVFLRLVIDAVAKLIKSNADVYEGMIVGIVVALAVTLTQFRHLVQTGREFFPGIRGWVAVPTLAIVVGLLGMMGSANVEALKGRTVFVGLVAGLGTLLLLGFVKLMESRRSARE